MAESTILVPDSGTKKLHTFARIIGANTIEDEVVLLGENYLASYIVSATASTATANSHLMTINAGGTLKVRIRRIRITQTGLATAVALMNTNLVRTTTAAPTGGTAITPNPLDTTDAASGCTAMTLPTVKATEAAIVIQDWPSMLQTLGASTLAVTPLVDWDFDRQRSKPLILQAGTTIGIAIKNVTAVAGASVVTTVWLDESNF
jgi:hypothetical protein